MWQRNQIEIMFGTVRTKLSSDYLLQLFALDELRDRQTSDRNDQTRLQNRDLLIHPRRAVSNFVRRRDAIGPAG